MAKDYSVEVRIPSPENMNSCLSYPTAAFMLAKFGKPRTQMGSDCLPPTNRNLIKHLVYNYNVGPFKVSGLRLVCESLKRIFDKVRVEEPELYKQVSTAGMLCCRLIRGSDTVPSNHSWGAAIDLKINGKLDQRGDGMCQEGLLRLYKYFHEEGFFWGAEYRGAFEDAMHWEWAKETIEKHY
jgi:hypothetical protein